LAGFSEMARTEGFEMLGDRDGGFITPQMNNVFYYTDKLPYVAALLSSINRKRSFHCSCCAVLEFIFMSINS